MKILIIDNCVDIVGGVERTINTLSNALVKDNEVEILNVNRLVENSFYEYDKKIKKSYLFNHLNDKSKKYKRMSFRYILYKVIERLQEKLLKKKLIKQFFKQKHDYDVIIFGRVLIALTFLPVLKKLNIKSKIIVRDAIHLYYFNKKTKKDLLKYFPNMVDTFIVSSEESIKEYRRFFKTNSINLVKIYNPIGIKPIKKYNFEKKEVISVGRMDDKQKGFDNLIKAFSIVHKIHPDWSLKIYGDGGIKKDLLNLIDSLDAKDYIKIMLSTKNIVEVFNNSSIFVLPSRYEGYANILVEALSCGIPSISYDWLLGVDEIIKDGESGLVVNLKDRKKYFDGISDDIDCVNLSKKICYLIENPQIAQQLSDNAVKIIDSREPNMILNKWINIINGKVEK